MQSLGEYRSRHSIAAIRHVDVFKRRLRVRNLKRWRTNTSDWVWFSDTAADLAFGRRIMARALRKYLQAPDGLAACGMLALNPLLLMESARERLKRAIARARAHGDEERKQLLERRLVMLELACKEGVITVVRDLTQKN